MKNFPRSTRFISRLTVKDIGSLFGSQALGSLPSTKISVRMPAIQMTPFGVLSISRVLVTR